MLSKVDGFMVEKYQAFIGDTGSPLLKLGVWQRSPRKNRRTKMKGTNNE